MITVKIGKNIGRSVASFFFVFILLGSSTAFAGDACKDCKEFREKYSFLIPENYLLNNATGDPITGEEFSPPLHLMSIIGFFVSIIILIFGIHRLKKNKKYAVLILGLFLLVFSLWLKINADYLDVCFYFYCDIGSYL